MTSISPSNTPCTFRVYVVADTSGVLSLIRSGTTTSTEFLNQGLPLTANAAYTFLIPVDAGETINLQYSVAATFTKLSIVEQDLPVAEPQTSAGKNWSLGASDVPDVSVNQANALKTSATTTDEEDQSGGLNTKTYNPWGFVFGTTYTVRGTSGPCNCFANVQQSGARGYLVNVAVAVYNPTASSSTVTIDFYLYNHLPTSGPASTPRAQFAETFTLAAGAFQWYNIAPNIFWDYDCLVMIPQLQVGTHGTSAGVAVPEIYNRVNSHNWNNTEWVASDDGWIGYWSLTNTAPTGVPVQVMGGDVTATVSYNDAIIDPRQIRSLVASDLPGDTNFSRSPSGLQFPASLDSAGAFNTRLLSTGDTLGGTPITVNGGAIDPRQIRPLVASDIVSSQSTIVAKKVSPAIITGTASETLAAIYPVAAGTRVRILGGNFNNTGAGANDRLAVSNTSSTMNRYLIDYTLSSSQTYLYFNSSSVSPVESGALELIGIGESAWLYYGDSLYLSASSGGTYALEMEIEAVA